MINRPNGWDSAYVYGEKKTLPAGGYVCRIKQVAIQSAGTGEQLAVLIDITEGDYTGYYAAEFKNNIRADKKWKGVLRVWLPRGDGSEKDEWSVSALKGFTTAVERSNPGYVWNWDERSLCGKNVGVIFRREEWENGDKHGWATRPFRASAVDTIRSGDFDIPNDKPLKKNESVFSDMGAGYGAGNPFAASGNNPGYGSVDDGDLPF